MKHQKILIVEDDEEDFMLLERVLRDLPLEWWWVKKGEDAMAWLENNQCDAMLLNLSLPGKSGYAVLRECRQDVRWRGLLIYIITGHEDERERIKALQAGATSYFTKPYGDAANLTIWNQILRQKENNMGTHFKNPIIWLRGLIATFIGGGAGAVASGFVAVMQTPQQYNLHDGLGNLLRMIGGTFLVTGIVSAAAYLQKSPLPEVTEGDTTIFTKPPESSKP